MLEEQRRELRDQLDAIDAAIEALSSAGTPVAETQPAEPEVPPRPIVSAVLPRRVKPKRVQSDSHKEAKAVGRRKARAAKDAANGLAREMPSDSFVPAIKARGDSQLPRLVKRPTKK